MHKEQPHFPKWLPWAIAFFVAGYLSTTLVVGYFALRGQSSAKLDALARWLPIPAARVDGTFVWMREYIDYRTFVNTFMARSQQAGQVVNPEVPVSQQVLDLIVSNRILERAAREGDVVVTRSEVDAAFKTILVAQSGEGQPRDVSEAELNSILTELYGSDQGRLRDLIRLKLIENKVRSDVLEQVNFRQILVSDEGQANDLIGRLKNGDKFEDLAKEFSQHQESRDQGGAIGFVSRGEQLPAIEESIFTAPIGLIGTAIKTDFGFHIIEIVEKKGTVQQAYDTWFVDAEQRFGVHRYLKASSS